MTLTDAELLDRLDALNAQRAKEEASGLIRWLRPEYQNPGGTQSQQTSLAVDAGEEKAQATSPKTKATPPGRNPFPNASKLSASRFPNTRNRLRQKRSPNGLSVPIPTPSPKSSKPSAPWATPIAAKQNAPTYLNPLFSNPTLWPSLNLMKSRRPPSNF